MTPQDLKPGTVIQLLGERIYITEVQLHQRFGLEFHARRGHQPTLLWYSARRVERWLNDAQFVEVPELLSQEATIEP